MNRALCFREFKIKPWIRKLWVWNCDTFLSEYNTPWPVSSVISHMESLMLNTRFTYLRMFHLTQDFDIAEWYSKALKSRYKFKLHLGEYSNWLYRWITMQTWFSLLVSYHMLTMLGIPSCWEGTWAKATSSLSLFLLRFDTALGWVRYTLPCAGLANSGRHSFASVLINFEDKHSNTQLIYSTDIAIYLKQRLPSGHFRSNFSSLCNSDSQWIFPESGGKVSM